VIEPLRVSRSLDCSAEHAFATWTDRFGLWWPRGHTVSGDPGAEVVLERRAGGRIYERTPGGAEIDWGQVTTWEPPARIAYRWHIRRTPAEATDVEIRFVPLGPRTSRIDIVQTGWERLGDEGPGWRDANTRGWAGLLPHLVAACAT
jgi:uncharacterized protein YndB with AHSA1/START domain